MNFQSLTIEEIEIKQFKKIRNLKIEPGKRGNLFLGSSRSGKTSLCEFIQFTLYGADSVSLARGGVEDAQGYLILSADEKIFVVERSVIGGEESVRFYEKDTESEVDTELTPGEYLMGMDLDSFDLISYHRQAKYESPISRPKFSILNRIAASSENTREIYRDLLILKEKRRLFCNEEKDGSLDVLMKKEAKLQAELASYPELLNEIENQQLQIGEIREKIDENERKGVLLKAQIAEYSNELKLIQNKKNAEELHRKILTGEKKLRILSFDLKNKIGKLTKHELNQMKQDYNKLSLAAIKLNEARMALSSVQDNLAYHETLFTGINSLDNLSQVKEKLNKNKLSRLLISIFGILLMASSAALSVILYSKGFDSVTYLASGISMLLCGVAALCLSTLFTGKIKSLLEKQNLQSIPEFNELYEKVVAHNKTTQVYRDQLENCRERAEKKEEEKDQVHQRISDKIKALGYRKEDGEILAICDDIIEANDIFYDLEVEIDLDKAEYKRMLSEDIEDENATISEEFLNLQNKLSFLVAQNDALYKKKDALTSLMKEAEERAARTPDLIRQDLEKVETELVKVKFDFESADMNYALAKSKKDRFENDLKKILTKKINERMKFLLGEGESFLFDEEFELCFCDQSSVLPLIAAGGGVISEMGLLSFRLALAELMGKTGLPMIFDDSMSGLEKDDCQAFYQSLTETCSQFFIATSLQDHAQICGEDAKVIVL